MTATITKLSSEHYPWRWSLSFPYNAEMVEALKRCVPSRQRAWKPDLREWWFKEEARETILALAIVYCGEVNHTQREEEPPLPSEVSQAYRTLHLLPSAPPALVKAAYKALSKAYHPDKGGTTEAMQKLNQAFARLQERG